MTKEVTVPALEKALDILEFLAINDTSESIKILAGELKVPQASAFRIVNTLVKRGYLQKTEAGIIRLGPRNALLHRAFLTDLEIRKLAEPIMSELLAKTQATIELTSFNGEEITFIDVLDSPRPVTVRFNRKIGIPLIGSSNPITMAVLAHIKREQQENLIHRMGILRDSLLKLEPWLKQFPFDTKLDKKLIDMVKKQGFAADFGVQTPDVSRIVCPLFGVNQGVVGTIGVAGPQFYLEEEHSQGVINTVKKYAEKLSYELGNQNQGELNE